MMEMSFVPVVSIMVICYVFAELIKHIPKLSRELIPVLVAILGAVLAGVGTNLGITELIGHNIYDAIAVGAISGLSSSGVFSMIKNLSKMGNN